MRTERRWLVGIVLISVVLRVGAAFVLGDVIQDLPGIYDQISYHTLATRLLGGFGFTFARQWWPLTAAGTPTAHWSYLYTLWIAAVYALVGVHPLVVRLLQAVSVGALMPFLTYRVARRALGVLDPAQTDQIHWPALVAAAWTALYGYFIYYTAALMTEAFFMTGVLWCLDCTLRLSGARLDAAQPAAPVPARWRAWLELGLAMAVTAYLREVFLVVAPALLGWLLIDRVSHAPGSLLGRLRVAWRQSAAGLLASVAVVAALLAPATLFNYRQFQRFVLLNTNSGYAFFWANHPIYGDHFVGILPDNISYPSLIPAELRPLGVNEAALESALMQRGVGFVLADPARYVRLSLSRIPVYFQFWPSSDSGLVSNLTRVGSFGLALPFMLLGLYLWLRDWRQPTRRASAWRSSLLILFSAAFSLIHLLSWALTRYRLPVDAVGLIFAARGLTSLIAYARQRLATAKPRLAAA
jgi:hypothetical protein